MHLPHRMQDLLSITGLQTMDIAPEGHTLMHVPHSSQTEFSIVTIFDPFQKFWGPVSHILTIFFLRVTSEQIHSALSSTVYRNQSRIRDPVT